MKRANGLVLGLSGRALVNIGHEDGPVVVVSEWYQ